jgi:phosphate uptake regulator
LQNSSKNASTRKIQKIRSSFLISLPKSWIVSSGLKQGDEITINPTDDGSLLLHPITKKKKSMEILIELDPQWNSEIIRRNIIAAYLNGYDIIRINYPPILSIDEDLKWLLERLEGITVTEESKNQIELKNIVNSSDFPLEQTLRRTSLITLKMHEDSIRALEKKDRNLAQEIINRDVTIDKQYMLLSRQLRILGSTRLGSSGLDAIDFFNALRRIEHIADHTCRISRSIIDMNLADQHPIGNSEKLLLEIGKLSYEIHEDASKSLFTKDMMLANKAIEAKVKIDKLKQSFDNELVKERQDLVLGYSSIVYRFERIADYSTDIAEAALKQYSAR